MTKQEQNNIILQVWQEHLQRKDKLPERIADIYSKWLRGVIQQASPLLTTQNNQPAQEPQQAEQPQEEQQQAEGGAA